MKVNRTERSHSRSRSRSRSGSRSSREGKTERSKSRDRGRSKSASSEGGGRGGGEKEERKSSRSQRSSEREWSVSGSGEDEDENEIVPTEHKFKVRKSCETKYRKLRTEIGEGVHGVVFDACLGDDCSYAWKVAPLSSFSRSPEHALALAEETTDIAHFMGEKGIGPRVYDSWICYVDSKGVDLKIPLYFMVMEKLQGVVLSDFLQSIRDESARDKRAEFDRARTQAEEMLEEMHDLQVVHRDLNSGNIFVGKHRVWFIDFGQSRRYKLSDLELEDDDKVAGFADDENRDSNLVEKIFTNLEAEMEDEEMEKKGEKAASTPRSRSISVERKVKLEEKREEYASTSRSRSISVERKSSAPAPNGSRARSPFRTDLELEEDAVLHDAQQKMETLNFIVSKFVESKECFGKEELSRFWIHHLVNGLSSDVCIIQPRKRGEILDLHQSGKIDNLDLFLTSIRECKQKLIVVPLKLSFNKQPNPHGNLILIDHIRKTYERFEPYGHKEGINDKFVDYFFEKILPLRLPALQLYRYLTPLDLCPMGLGPQKKQAKDKKRCPGGGGFCVVFTTYYFHLRLLAPKLPAPKLIDLMLDQSPDELLSFIRRYLTWMTVAQKEANLIQSIRSSYSPIPEKFPMEVVPEEATSRWVLRRRLAAMKAIGSD